MCKLHSQVFPNDSEFAQTRVFHLYIEPELDTSQVPISAKPQEDRKTQRRTACAFAPQKCHHERSEAALRTAHGYISEARTRTSDRQSMGRFSQPISREGRICSLRSIAGSGGRVLVGTRPRHRGRRLTQTAHRIGLALAHQTRRTTRGYVRPLRLDGWTRAHVLL